MTIEKYATSSYYFIKYMCLTQLNLIPPHHTSSGFPHNLRGKRSDSTWIIPGGRDSVPCGLSLAHVTASVSCRSSLTDQEIWVCKCVSIVVTLKNLYHFCLLWRSTSHCIRFKQKHEYSKHWETGPQLTFYGWNVKEPSTASTMYSKHA